MYKLCVPLIIISLYLAASGSGVPSSIIGDPFQSIKQSLELDAEVLSAAAIGTNNNSTKRYAIAKFDFEKVSQPYIICLWIIIVGVAKIGFNLTPKLSSICPESVVLMVLGVLIGLVFYYGGVSTNQSLLTPDVFFFYMLPPIVMDAGYHMPNRLFFDNLNSILMYAVLGTIWNTLTIGAVLYWVATSGFFGVSLPLLDALLFSTIVSAVDPVAVLAVFEEIHVNDVLYILVFGESLLNDGVTVVLYKMFEGYIEMGADNLLPIDYISGITSFFVIALGGTLIGVFWGIGAAFVSRFTHHVKIIEPIFVFVMSYLAYLSAEMFHLSGILALTFSGMTMKNYVTENVSQTSQTTLKYAMKMLANASESVIFLFLGVCTVTDSHNWNTAFVLSTIGACLVFRALGVIIFTSIANRFRLHRLSGMEQFIMAYGGLRGAVAFALVLLINEKLVPTKRMMVTTVIALVYFTVFLQGMTVGPLVKILKVPRSNKYEKTMNERVHERLMDHLMAGIEDISGMMVGNYKIRDKFRHFDNQYLKHWLLRESHDRSASSRKIFETISRLNMQDAINMVKESSVPSLYLNNNNLPTTKSLSSLFRSYTQANLSSSNEQTDSGHLKPNYFTNLPMDHNVSTNFNFDVGNIEYNPSKRDLVDFEVHHILSDNVFKPVKRYRKYSKTDLADVSPQSTFQHQAKLEVRHLVNQTRHRRRNKKKTNSNNSSSNNHNNRTTDEHLNQRPNHLSINSRFVGRAASFPSILNSPDDGGIIFVARPNNRDEEKIEIKSIYSPTTTTEATLPWRRKSTTDPVGAMNSNGSSPSNSGPLKQSEFPSWIENKDYISNYASPTNTILRRIDDPNHNDKRPTVYEIFTITENIEDSGSARDEVDTLEMNGSNNHLHEQHLNVESSKPISSNYSSNQTALPVNNTTVPSHSPPILVNARINMGFLDDNNQNSYRL
ncbi:sodium/hydrogen exchanger 3-like isoform X1 [Tetranychus urticae]|uniref:sodium/hydrogen exchanger 3-like isoform X1 n=1 Tax=Tetranychus urticae TaxID=32264 RepID=UPI00077BEE6A|nr:sodium/hydrogen exchanger 3-like isoform X1 [Tetranychus urticae]